MIPAALLKIAIPAIVAVGLTGWGYVERQGRQLSEEREKAKDLVIKSQADELDRTKRLHVASQATADELQRRLEADRARDEDLRRTLDEAIQAARVAGAKDCPTPAGIESVLRGQLRRP